MQVVGETVLGIKPWKRLDGGCSPLTHELVSGLGQPSDQYKGIIVDQVTPRFHIPLVNGAFIHCSSGVNNIRASLVIE